MKNKEHFQKLNEAAEKIMGVQQDIVAEQAQEANQPASYSNTQLVLAAVAAAAVAGVAVCYREEIAEAATSAWDWTKEKANEAYDWTKSKLPGGDEVTPA